jgi:hypothetical protein
MTNKDNKDIQEYAPLDATGKATLIALITSTSVREAAEKLGISERTVFKHKKKYGLQKVIDSIPEIAFDTLKLGSARAAEVMVKKLEDRNQGLDASKEILDRVGLGKGPQVAVQVNVKPILGGETVKYVYPNDSDQETS